MTSSFAAGRRPEGEMQAKIGRLPHGGVGHGDEAALSSAPIGMLKPKVREGAPKLKVK
jgi:hypothetical protein